MTRKRARIALIFALVFFVAIGMTACGSGSSASTDSSSPASQSQEKKSSQKKSDSSSSSSSSEKTDSEESSTDTESNSSGTQQKSSGTSGTSGSSSSSSSAKYVTISIDCTVLVGNTDNLTATQKAKINKTGGWILKATKVKIGSSDTVYTVLGRVTKAKGIQLSAEGNTNTKYIKGIDNLAEFDAGDQSGWMYSVNGVFPDKGCGTYKVKSGDVIRWRYTTNLGADLK
ncbi:MAG: DUF4430 domain-containing protein [Anaerovoracaceae bacterium]